MCIRDSSAVEAATIGCPVVATQGHVFEEVLGDFAHFVPRQAPSALANAIRETAWSDKERRYLPPKFDKSSHVDAVRKIYAELVES